jgi:hypothetical protein
VECGEIRVCVGGREGRVPDIGERCGGELEEGDGHEPGLPYVIAQVLDASGVREGHVHDALRLLEVLPGREGILLEWDGHLLASRESHQLRGYG